MNKYLDGWTCEEAACFAASDFKSLDEVKKRIDSTNLGNYNADQLPQWDDSDEVELSMATKALVKIEELLEALHHSVHVAIEHYQFAIDCEHAHMGHILPEDIILNQPEESTEIELYRYTPGQSLNEVKIKKDSFAIWLYKIGEESMSQKVSPNLNVRDVLAGRKENKVSMKDAINTFSTSKDWQGIDEETIPTPIYWALSIFKEAWLDLPSDMRKPKKAELEALLRSKDGGLTKEMIESIIKVSTPDNIILGGKPNPKLREWMPLNERS